MNNGHPHDITVFDITRHAAPAPGAGIHIEVATPATLRHAIQCARFTFTTDATAVDRFVSISLWLATAEQIRFFAPRAQPANTAWDYCFVPNATSANGIADLANRIMCHVSPEVIIPNCAFLIAEADGMVAGDVFSASIWYYRSWVQGTIQP